MKALGIVFSLLLLAGCTGGNSDRDGGESEPGQTSETSAPPATVIDGLPTAAERVWSTRLPSLQTPVVADDVLVTAVAARGDEIDVVALDRADGSVLWRKPLQVVNARVGSYLGDLVYESKAGEKYVVMQQAAKGNQLRAGAALPYLAIEPRTGKVVARTRPVVAQFGAPACDDGRDVCLRITPGETFQETRWVLDSWKLQPEKDRLPTGGNSVVSGSDVYTIFGSLKGYSAVTEVGRVGSSSWRVPQAKITRGKDWLIDVQSGFLDEEAGVVVLQLFRLVDDATNRRYLRGDVVKFDLDERRTVGLDVETGKILWRHTGADINCLDLTRYEDVPVRCAFSGKRTYQQDRDPKLASAQGWLEGYDAKTGETTWRQELSARAVRTLVLEMNTLDAQLSSVLDADELMVLATPEGERLLSLVDGSSRALEETEPVLCRISLPYPHRFDAADSSVIGFGDTRERNVATPCDATGKTKGPIAKSPLGPAALLTGGLDAGDDTWVLATRTTVDAYRVS